MTCRTCLNCLTAWTATVAGLVGQSPGLRDSQTGDRYTMDRHRARAIARNHDKPGFQGLVMAIDMYRKFSDEGYDLSPIEMDADDPYVVP